MVSGFSSSDGMMKSVICVFDRQGRFTIAAKHHMTIAEIYESELVDIEKVPLNVHLLDVDLHSASVEPT